MQSLLEPIRVTRYKEGVLKWLLAVYHKGIENSHKEMQNNHKDQLAMFNMKLKKNGNFLCHSIHIHFDHAVLHYFLFLVVFLFSCPAGETYQNMLLFWSITTVSFFFLWKCTRLILLCTTIYPLSFYSAVTLRALWLHVDFWYCAMWNLQPHFEVLYYSQSASWKHGREETERWITAFWNWYGNLVMCWFFVYLLKALELRNTCVTFRVFLTCINTAGAAFCFAF